MSNLKRTIEDLILSATQSLIDAKRAHARTSHVNGRLPIERHTGYINACRDILSHLDAVPPPTATEPTDGEPNTVEGTYGDPDAPERYAGEYGSHDGFDHPLQSDLDR